MIFSRRTGWNFEANELTRIREEKEKNKEDILDLTLSNPTACGFAYLKTDFLTALTDVGSRQYQPSARGLLKAREAVSAYYAEKNRRIHPDQIFLTASTSEAYNFIFRLLCDAGDSVLIPSPGYPLFHFLADLNDIEAPAYRLRYDDGWRMEQESLCAAIKKNTKAILVVNPNNPTGNFVRPEEKIFLNRTAAKKCALISDEVFLDFIRREESAEAASFAGNTDTLTFTLSGISKILGLPQMKMAWIAVSGPPDECREAMKRLEVIADTYLSAGTPAQNALPVWLDKRQTIIGEIRTRVQNNETALQKRFGARVLAAEGGWYACLKLEEGAGEEEYCLDLLRKKNIFAHPGYFFDFEREGFLVLSLLLPEDKFKKAISGLL